MIASEPGTAFTNDSTVGAPATATTNIAPTLRSRRLMADAISPHLRATRHGDDGQIGSTSRETTFDPAIVLNQPNHSDPAGAQGIGRSRGAHRLADDNGRGMVSVIVLARWHPHRLLLFAPVVQPFTTLGSPSHPARFRRRRSQTHLHCRPGRQRAKPASRNCAVTAP